MTTRGRGESGGHSARERALLDEVFGDTLPETTSDEAREPDTGLGDAWWREQRPPHHG